MNKLLQLEIKVEALEYLIQIMLKELNDKKVMDLQKTIEAMSTTLTTINV